MEEEEDEIEVRGIDFYFEGNDPFEPDDDEIRLISLFRDFFQNCHAKFISSEEAQFDLKKYRRIRIEWPYFKRCWELFSQQVDDDIPEVDLLESLVLNSPERVIGLMSVGAHQVVFDKNEQGYKLNLRISHWEDTIKLKDLKSNLVEKFVQIKGNVIRAGSIKPLVTSMEFACKGCNSKRRHYLTDGFYTTPTGCANPKCKRANFEEDRTSAATLDWQKLRIQEIMEVNDLDNGRIPRTIDIEVVEDLVDCVIPGDVIVATGIVKAIKTEISGKDRNRVVYVLYLQGVSVTKQKSDAEDRCAKISSLMKFAKSDLQFVAQCASIPDLFRVLVHSVCPTIYGHDMVKAGILLTLVGGVPRPIDGTKNVFIRGDPHMLIVGDPGLGKSQMLRSAAQISPRGVYVCGNSTSAAGLTVTMVRDGGDASMEAGALVLGDQGLCCLDEMDKMGPTTCNALLEAMEQQSISVAKAGLCCTLSARTSVLAAANPVGGHYDKSKTVNENLKISNVLLSRFDLTFILIDKPDRKRDELLCKHIMNLHRPAGYKSQREVIKDNVFGTSQAGSLAERLALRPGEKVDEIPPELLRKLFAYIRRYVHPTLSEEAKKVLQDFYLQLRKDYQSNDSTPITTRQLESMIRLAQARARAEIRETVTKVDAEDVIELMKDSLYDCFADEHACVDFTKSKGVSKSKGLNLVKKALQKAYDRKMSNIFHESELKEIIMNNLRICTTMNEFQYYINMLNQQNFLLQQRNKLWKYMC